jgi:hypothetical protein
MGNGTRALLALSILIVTLAAGCKRDGGNRGASTNAAGTNVPATSASDETLISGRVIFKGEAPAPKPISLDALCGKLHNTPPVDTEFKIGVSNALEEVFVYLKGVPDGAGGIPDGETPVLDQNGCVYSPRVFGVMAGQGFRVRNSDPLLHNVHALPKKNKEFNFAQPIKGQVNERKFTEPEVLVRIKCDVHPWMNAWVGVVPHKFFAVTDEKGEFRLPAGVSPGKYTLEAVHYKGLSAAQEITIAPGENKHVELTLTLAPPAP